MLPASCISTKETKTRLSRGARSLNSVTRSNCVQRLPLQFASTLACLCSFFLLGIRFETLPTRVCCRAGREVQVFRVAAPRASSSWLWFSVSLCQVSITRGYFAKRLPHQTGFFFHSSVSFPDQIPHVPRRCFAANGVELPGRGECDFAEQNPYSSAWSQALANN